MKPISASPTLRLLRAALGRPLPARARSEEPRWPPSPQTQMLLVFLAALTIAVLWSAALGALFVPASLMARKLLGDSRLLVDNPVITKDIRETLDTRRSVILLAIFTGALAITVLMAWPRGDQLLLDIDTVARRLFLVIGATLLALVALLATTLSAVVISGEKERHCFEMLITTGLHERQILLGKMLSSLLFLLLLLAASIPFVSVALLLGGIAPPEIIALYLCLLDAAVIFSLIGLFSSCLFERNNAALGTAHIIALPVMALAMSAFLESNGPPELLPLLLFSVILWAAARVILAALSRTIRRPRELRIRDEEEMPLRPTATGLVLNRNLVPDRWLAPPRRRDLLPDGANPVLDKEIRSEIVGQGTLMLRLIIQIALLAVLPAIFIYLMGRPSALFAYLTVFSLLIAPSFACGMFTGEHENGTFALLATTLLTPRQIVLAKYTAAARLMLVLLGIIAVPTVAPILIAHVSYHSTSLSVVGACALTSLVWTFALVAIGLAWSLFARRTTAALIGTYLTGAGLALGPLLFHQVIRSFTDLPERWATLALPLSPLAHHLALAPSSSLLSSGQGTVWLPQTGGWGAWAAFIAGAITLTAALLAIMIRRLDHTWRRCQG